MKFEHTQVFNLEGAIRGMRNPHESWEKSDSFECDPCDEVCSKCRYNGMEHSISFFENDNKFIVGKNDLELMQSLIKAGSEHRKFMRQIFVSVDITAPLYWWKEFDTYKVGTVANSTSTMHKLASTPITLDCFECSELLYPETIEKLEMNRLKYLETKNKEDWKRLIVNLPESWLQKRTVTMNYENLLGSCSKGQRRNHKLTEWSVDFMNWARTLPYAKDLFMDEE